MLGNIPIFSFISAINVSNNNVAYIAASHPNTCFDSY